MTIYSRRSLAIFTIIIFVLIEFAHYLIGLTEEKLPGDDIHDFIPPFIPVLNDYSVSSNHKLLACNIRKSMSQLSFNIMCYLNNTAAYEKYNQSFSDIWFKDRNACPRIYWWHNNPLFESGELKMSELTKFAFIRHPEERFASFFLDKCLRGESCGKCTEPRCVAKQVYERLMQVTRNQTNLIKDDENMWTVWHTAPQTWNCDFHKYLNDFHLIPIGTSPDERKFAMTKLRRVLKFAGIQDKYIDKIAVETEKSDTAHSTYKSLRKDALMEQIRTDPYIQHYLHRTYYYDYVAFGFNMTGIVTFPQNPKIIVPRKSAQVSTN